MWLVPSKQKEGDRVGRFDDRRRIAIKIREKKR